MTLLETVVVMLLITILSGLAVVSLKNAIGGVKDKDAQRTLRAVVDVEVAHERTRGAFTADPAELKALEGSYTYTANGTLPATTGTVSVMVGTDTFTRPDGTSETVEVVGVATLSSSGNCFTMSSAPFESTRPDTFGRPAPGQCTGAQALTEEAVAW